MSDREAMILRYLRAAHTRRVMARALGGGDHPNETYLGMATAVLAKLQDDHEGWTALLAEPPAPAQPEPLDVERIEEALWHSDAIWRFRNPRRQEPEARFHRMAEAIVEADDRLTARQ